MTGAVRGDEIAAAAGSAPVIIRPGAPTRPALFCVHAEAGDVSLYTALAHRLTFDGAVLGLCAPAAEEAGNPPSLARIAAHHVRTIIAAQPDGPLLVVGECTGGALAYEIAQQLRAGGREAALLALIDAFPPGLPRLRAWTPRPLHRLLHRARILGFHLANLARLDMAGRRAYVAAKAARARAALGRKAAAMRGGNRKAAAVRGGFAAAAVRGGARDGASGVSQLAFRDAFAAYAPTPYPCSAVLLRASQMPLGAVVAPDLGWGGLVGDLQIETIPGYFTTPISEPCVRVLAERLSRYVAKAAAEVEHRSTNQLYELK